MIFMLECVCQWNSTDAIITNEIKSTINPKILVEIKIAYFCDKEKYLYNPINSLSHVTTK